MPAITNLGDLMPRDRNLSKIAIIDLGGERPREFSFKQLDDMANGVARALSKSGLQRGDRVAILSANRTEYLAACYGIMRAGFVAVPVNFKFPRPTIEFIVRDCGAKFCFCDPARAADCPPDIASVTFGASFDAFADPGPFAAVVPEPDEPAMFLYTSGSTGLPKGVVLSHQSHIWVVQTRLAPGLDRHIYLIAAPLYHMNALALAKLACAAHATIVLLPHFSAPAYIEAIGRYRCSFLTAVPPMIAMMLRERELMARTDLSSVEFVRMGSAPVSSSLMAALHAALPHAVVTNAYGTTEAGPVAFGPHPRGLKEPELSVGYPHPKVELRLVDGEDRDAEQGVLEMKCPALMLGYHTGPSPSPPSPASGGGKNNESSPASGGGERKVPSGGGEARGPITPDGFYVTGDVFRRDADGFYYFVGRADDMFVSGGENIYPANVERMLERHPDLAQAAVVPIDDDIKGQKPVAFVIRKAGHQLDEDAVKQFALEHAPAYQYPRFVWFVDDLPLASTNKLDRATLIRMARERMERE